MKVRKIADIARTVRSKNAGSFMITLEIIFDDADIYKKVKESNAISQETIAVVYGLPADEILDFVFYDAGLGIKANFRRKTPSGGPGESDVYGCQQYAPLLSLEVPWE